MSMTITQKFNKLRTILSKMDSVLVAYSGGVDSTLLLKVAKDVLKNKVLAVITKSPIYSLNEIKSAENMAKKLGVKYKTITTHQLTSPNFYSNPINRCYYCKKELFSRLKNIAEKNKLKFVVDGSNYDDRKDFRPGNRAKDEFGIRSPLQEAGLTKSDIRILSRRLKLSTWDKPALACLASRFPYGLPLKKTELEKVNKAEEFLRGLGFKQVRVRHYKDTTRIEVEDDKIKKLVNSRKSIVKRFKKLGYTYITLDLEGYRKSGVRSHWERYEKNLS